MSARHTSVALALVVAYLLGAHSAPAPVLALDSASERALITYARRIAEALERIDRKMR